MSRIVIGIINCDTGKMIIEKTLENNAVFIDGEQEFQEKALLVLKKVSEWFDKQNTFFSGKPLWEHWEKMGMTAKFEAVIEGRSDLAAESIAVFKDSNSRSEEHEIYVKRIIQ